MRSQDWPWVDPAAIRDLVQSVGEAYRAAPCWVQVALLVMLAVGFLVVVFRVARSMAGRVIGIVLAVMKVVVRYFYGSVILEHLPWWLD